LGAGWTVQNYGGNPANFEVFKGGAALPVDEAWRLTYLLRAHPGVTSAEPVFKVAVTDRLDWNVGTAAPQPPPGQPAGGAGQPHGVAMVPDIFSWVCGEGADFP